MVGLNFQIKLNAQGAHSVCQIMTGGTTCLIGTENQDALTQKSSSISPFNLKLEKSAS